MLTGKLAVLAGRTAPRKEMGEAVAAEVTRSLVRMLSSFSERVALAAIERWPATEGGRFFPTENELQALCLSIQRAVRTATPALPPQQPDEGKVTTPAERAVMVQKLRALTLAMASRGRDALDLRADTQLVRDEYARLRQLFAAQDAADLALAERAGYRTVGAYMAGGKLA